ncbi:class I SAM-dependent methyltransferase [Candidatus Woesearchaeota archaeon]|jgi:16S rRNA (guanine1207-N2)-methyltransferase|nr:class I SAM-dependent methyltransferase [Candidatus Woesearchaeota archaeon]MBT6519477.1 class I SAM-dependent methyltransferase [Candidatus Woesearchaeota archaeon]MBT7368225.1 class I SAM-dependent methyltransferase [Candidatus Woesearchaeota archaeon]
MSEQIKSKNNSNSSPKAEHYYSKKQSSRFDIDEIEAFLRGTEFKFYVAPGVFSKTKVDRGTEVLVENMIIPESGRVLDLGCGYGVVGIVLKRLFPDVNVIFSDSNQRAIILTRKNIKLNGMNFKFSETLCADKFSKLSCDEKFDGILLNPPQSAGKQLCFDMITESKNFLNVDGTLQIVARHTKGGKTLSKKMEEIFGNVDVVKRQSGYRVYISKNI